MAAEYTDLDREIIILSAVWDLIDSMVNYKNFEANYSVEAAELMFKTRECSELFLILLADLLSWPQRGAFGIKHQPGSGSAAKTYLGNLVDIAKVRRLKGDTLLLMESAIAFSVWLDDQITLENVWLPSIERNGPVTVGRMEYLKICGTASKHGFTRLGGIVRQIRSILEANETVVDEGQSYLVIPEFQDWFGAEFIRCSTKIAFLLNQIRWGIYTYLRAEYKRAMEPYTVGTLQAYRYNVPDEIVEPLIKSVYWELMNKVSKAPYFPRFVVSKYVDS